MARLLSGWSMWPLYSCTGLNWEVPDLCSPCHHDQRWRQGGASLESDCSLLSTESGCYLMDSLVWSEVDGGEDEQSFPRHITRRLFCLLSTLGLSFGCQLSEGKREREGVRSSLANHLHCDIWLPVDSLLFRGTNFSNCSLSFSGRGDDQNAANAVVFDCDNVEIE